MERSQCHEQPNTETFHFEQTDKRYPSTSKHSDLSEDTSAAEIPTPAQQHGSTPKRSSDALFDPARRYVLPPGQTMAPPCESAESKIVYLRFMSPYYEISLTKEILDTYSTSE
jgi:hypothetical protein